MLPANGTDSRGELGLLLQDAFFYRIVAAAQLRYPPAERSEKANSEEREQKLPCHSPESHPESHPVVLYVENLEPVAEHRDALPYRHIGPDQDLDDLVDDGEDKPEKEKQPPFPHQFLPCLDSISLASTVRVA